MCIQDYLQCTKQLYAFGYRIPQVRSTTELSAGAQERFRSDLVIGNKENDDQVRFQNILCLFDTSPRDAVPTDA